MTAQARHGFLWLLLAILLSSLVACAPPTPKPDPQASKIDVVNLPKFGYDPHWGGLEIPEKILEQRAELLQQLAERNTQPQEFALEVTETGWDALSQLDFSTAMRRFNQAWLIYPQSAFAIMGMAMVVYERDGDTKGALLLMESLEEPLKDQSTYWINRASMERRAEMTVEALKHYEIAAQIEPDNPLVVGALVELYSQATNFLAACAMLNKARTMQVPINEQLARFVESNAQSNCRIS